VLWRTLRYMYCISGKGMGSLCEPVHDVRHGITPQQNINSHASEVNETALDLNELYSSNFYVIRIVATIQQVSEDTTKVREAD
jgi:hypothetical protein